MTTLNVFASSYDPITRYDCKSKSSTIIICPVEDTGINSVKPSTSPRTNETNNSRRSMEAPPFLSFKAVSIYCLRINFIKRQGYGPVYLLTSFIYRLVQLHLVSLLADAVYENNNVVYLFRKYNLRN